MECKDHRAHTGAAAVTLIAIVGFCCMTAAAPADPAIGWQTLQASAQPQAGTAQQQEDNP